MRAEEIKGLMEAYSHVYETPEVLSEEVIEEDLEALDEQGRNKTPQAVIDKNRAALGNTLLYGNPQGRKPVGGGQGNRARRTRPTPAAQPAPAKKPMANIPPSEGTGRGGPSDIAKKPAPAPAKPASPAAAKPAPAPAAKPTPSATAKPAGSAMDQWAKANPKLAAAKAERDRTRGTSATTNPLMKDMKSSLPAPKSPSPSTATTGFNLAKKGVNLAAGVDIFDLVKGHLLDEGYAETEENAIVMMANMSEEWRETIIMELTGGKGHPGYKAGSKDHGPMQDGHPADSNKRRAVGGTMSMRHGYHLGDMDDEDEDEDDLESIVKQQSRDSRERVRKPLRDKVKAARKKMTKEGIELEDILALSRRMERVYEAQRARENPEDHDKEEKKKYEKVRGEKTPMPPRGDKRREDFEKWYAKQMGR